jgi:hypothetical protein
MGDDALRKWRAIDAPIEQFYDNSLPEPTPFTITGEPTAMFRDDPARSSAEPVAGMATAPGATLTSHRLQGGVCY